MKKIEIEVGNKYGRLTAVSPDGKNKEGRTMWKWRCDCGNVISRVVKTIVGGHQISCGCYRLEKLRDKIVKHGGCKDPEFKVWNGMKARCYIPSATDYAIYGGRGIIVSDEWKNSYAAFIRDMGKRPTPKHSIERIDPDGNYEPGNCVWATTKQQGRNKRDTRRLMFRGNYTPLSEIAEVLGCVHSKITYWTDKVGITADEFETLHKAMLSVGVTRMRMYSITDVVTTPETNLNKLFEGCFWVVVRRTKLSTDNEMLKIIHKKIYGKIK